MTHSATGDRMARLRQAGSGHRRRMPARPVSEEISDQVSHRSFRSALAPVASGLAAVIAISWPAPAHAAAGYAVAGQGVQAREWWLGGLHVRQTWPRTEGAGITVAVLSTGVDPRFPDLAGSVTTGPDYTYSGRTAGGPLWGINGTGVAAAIAGHGHGAGRAEGLLGVAPAAKILSVRVTLEYNDPLNSDQAIARRLPGAIASGIIYAVDHGARVIDLPLDPGTAGADRSGQPGRGWRQPGRAGGGGVRAAQERGAGRPGRRRRPGSGPGGPPGRLPRGHRGGRGRQERAGRPVQQQALVCVADRPGRRADLRDPARRLRADQLHQRIRRHRGRRGRPHPVPVPAPHRGSGRPGADRGHHQRQDHRARRRARHHRRGPGGRPGHVHQRRRGARPSGRHAHTHAKPAQAVVDHRGARGERQRPGRLAGPVRRGRPVRADRAAGGAAPGDAPPAGAAPGGRA